MKKLSNQLKNESIDYLEKYLKLKRKKRLSKWKIIKIKELIKEKKKGLDEFTNEILKSPLYKLAEVEIIREGHVNKFKVSGKNRYEIDPAKTLLMMLKIVDKVNQQGQQYKLNEYCEAFNVKKV